MGPWVQIPTETFSPQRDCLVSGDELIEVPRHSHLFAALVRWDEVVVRCGKRASGDVRWADGNRMTHDKLVRSRKGCRLCIDDASPLLRNGSSFDFDPPVVSYWLQWLGHQRPRLLVVGQDFSGADYFERNRGKDDPSNPTNLRLRDLLAEAGITVAQPPAPDPAAPVYLTNSILCLKRGGMSGSIRTAWVRNCARQHLAPLLDYLRPQAVVAMGGPAWRAVQEVFPGPGLPGGIKDAAGRSWMSPSGCGVFAVGHCSGLGLVSRPWQRQLSDWREIGQFLA